jgi:hypothetical protein
MRIKAIHVPDRLAEMLKEGSNDTDASNTASTAAKGRLADEFDSLEHFDSKQHLYSRKEGRRADNQKKNRYKNIVPFDHTRIVLNADDLTPEQRQDVGHDYINANKIEVPVVWSLSNDGCTFADFARLSRVLMSGTSFVHIDTGMSVEHNR